MIKGVQSPYGLLLSIISISLIFPLFCADQFYKKQLIKQLKLVNTYQSNKLLESIKGLDENQFLGKHIDTFIAFVKAKYGNKMEAKARALQKFQEEIDKIDGKM